MAPPPSFPLVRSRAQLRATIALGASLAPRGAMVKLGFVVAAITVLIAVVSAIVLARGEAAPPLAQLTSVTSSALAWGAGMLIAFSASAQALRRDRTSGLRVLLRGRGASTTTYARGRVLGLALVLLVVVGGGTLVCGLATVLVAARAGAGARAAQGLFASLAYATAFSAVAAPLTLAAIGGRSLGQGYAGLLLLLVVPELLEPWTAGLVPAGWGDLLSVPSALAALRASLFPSGPGMTGIDLARLARAACVVAAFTALCFVLVRAEILRVDAEEADAPEGGARA